MTIENCIVCDTKMQVGLTSWHKICPKCKYESAALPPSINTATAHEHIDEHERASALYQLRNSNFKILLDAILRIEPNNTAKKKTLLDVGCAHGWFLKSAEEHFDATGIEPDAAVASHARKNNTNVLEGYFPSILPAEEKYNVISFNDVFEHLPDLNKTIESCKAHLMTGGILLINLPSTDGFFYRVSCLLHRLGFPNSFDRMWQKDLPSPHLHYFNEKNLKEFLTKNGFEIRLADNLPSIRISGLWDRITYASQRNTLRNVLTFFIIVTILPFLNLLPKDIHFQIAQLKVPKNS